MKKIVNLLILTLLIGCEDNQAPMYLMALASGGDTKQAVESEPIQTPTVSESIETEEPEIVGEEPVIEPSPYRLGFIYLVDKDSEIVYSGVLESIETVNAYNTQNLLMNEMGDPRCPCTVIHGTYVVQVEE